MIYENLRNVFEIHSVSPQQVVLKVNVRNALTVAQYPFVNTEMEFISVTRGENHVMTVVKHNGQTWSIEFGANGHTLISDSVKVLKDNVLRFINDNHIMINYCGGDVTMATIYYNSYYRKWQLSLNIKLDMKGSRNCYYWSECAEDLDTAIQDFAPIVAAEEWRRDFSNIDVWRAVNPVYNIL